MIIDIRKYVILPVLILLLGVKPFTLQGKSITPSVSREAEKLISDFMDLRVNLSRTATDEEALDVINVFMNDFYFPVKESFSEEEQLILENFYITERYNYLQYDKENGRPVSEKELLERLEKNDAFFGKNKDRKISSWALVTSANAIGCYMSFKPTQTALKYGTVQKEWYKTAYEQDPDFWYGTAHMAQWYFFAPGFFGGSKKKALSLFNDALSLAETNAEKYYSHIFLSQFYFTEGNAKLSEEHLAKADTYLPGGRYVKFIRDANNKGKSYFNYEPEE